ncbi:carbohydrate porin [Pelagicoccus mobilis]|uniref:Carbohydrate porin n=1 Tax=Pelagicoccus mobilis TaxID=415221 RepID=A0A934VRJ1_9BACT|nr:carbohydrate porin [Pelagicoccus mobilis]MBK1877564.1 carbohydrate porin [Pelagicoccus mobilis]
MTLRNLVVTLAAVPVWAFGQSNAADEAAQLRAELNELRQLYETRIQALEARLESMEQAQQMEEEQVETVRVPDPLPASATVDPVEEELERYLKEAYANTTESRSISQNMEDTLFDERVENVLQNFLDISGYMRAGYGRNDTGGPQVGFGAPGAGAKYRLGNEPENFGELIFSKSFFVADRFSRDAQTRAKDDPIAHVQVRLDFYNPHESFSSGSDTTFGFPEAWASIGNVLEGQPQAKFWAGNRFYRRHDIGVNDFFFWNMSGGGGGIEDVDIGNGAKMAFAWIGHGSRSGITDVPEPDPENKAGFSKTNFDLRAYDIPFLSGHLEAGLVYSSVKSGLDANGQEAPDTDGLAVSLVHTKSGFLSDDGVNKFSIQYGQEAAKTFTSGFETFTNSSGSFIQPDLPGSWRVRVTENFTANLSDSFSLGPVFVYQYTDYGDNYGNSEWISAGVRPIFHLDKNWSLALEGGYDWVDDDFLGVSDGMFKFTIAPQLSIGNRFSSRPVIRAYATWADWGSEFMGMVGGNDFADETEGGNFGLQMETWW